MNTVRNSNPGVDVEMETENNGNFNVQEISPYSKENLISLNIWSEDGYKLFVERELTMAEKMVCTGVHQQVTILRLKTNGVPFAVNGVITYPLLQSYQARQLPAYDIANLPFVVTTFQDKRGNVREATIDMNNIRKIREWQSRLEVCPVYGTPRYRYRYYAEIPFHNDNMARLSNALEKPDERSYPKDLRTISKLEFHKRAEKVIQVEELQNCLQSGYEISTILWDAYTLSCTKTNSSSTAINFMHKVKAYVLQCKGNQQLNYSASENKKK